MPRSSMIYALIGLLFAPALSAQTVDLRFDWRPGAAAAVTVTNGIRAELPGQAVDQAFGMTYRLAVTEAEPGLRIDHSDFEVTGIEDNPVLREVMESGKDEVGSGLEDSNPDLLVTTSGSFVEVADLERIIEQMKGGFGSTPAPGMEAMAELMSGILDPDFVRDQARAGWDQMVGWWAGRTLAGGDPVTFETQAALPIVAGARLSSVVTLRYLGPADCIADSGAGDCVELESVQTFDDEATERAIELFMDRMLEMLGEELSGELPSGFGVDDLSMQTTTRLVTEPGTLRPRRVETTVKQETTMKMMGMTQRQSNTTTATAVYQWESR